MPDETLPQEPQTNTGEETNTVTPPEDEVMGSSQAQSIVNKEETAPTSAPVTDIPPAPKPRSKRTLVLLLILLIAVIGAGAYYWFMMRSDEGDSTVNTETSQTQEVQKFGVAVGLIEGVAEFSTDDGATWQKLAAETDLSEGNQIRTMADGRVVLLIDDGSALRLAYNSTVELTSLATTDVVVNNIAGEVYSRVTASSERRFSVAVDDASYTAKGTAYRTTNSSTKKGVEVFHSAVTKDTTEITEGNSYYTLTEQKEKENTVVAIDLAALKSDTFIKWNSEQDKKEAEFANALGVLVELDKPDPTPPAVPAPTPSTPSSGITLSGSVSGYSAVFSWKVSGVDTSKGYKLVKSKASQTPTYPENSAAYIEAGKTSYSLYVGDGKTYYYRICAYRGDSCVSYSNTVTVTTPEKPKDPVVLGGVTLSLSGTTASWVIGGTAPYGYKLVMDTDPSPTYGSADKTVFTSSTSTSLPSGLTSGSTYYVRVCKYDNGGCVDYSNELTYLAP